MYNQSEIDLIPHFNSIKPTISESFRSLFYLIPPRESLFKDVSFVPDYTSAANTAFFTLIALEYIIAIIKGRKVARANDALTSVGAGINSRLIRLLTKKSIELTLYIYVYDNWRLVDLPWNSSFTWFLSFLGMDLAYYWFHRAAHEINILWVAHQTHHSSEDYNLTTALRQSAFQGYGSMFFYLPCGLLIPPSVHLFHLQVNILFQFWIHTELVDSLGPLEYILNTPSHHRVHHGRNPYCIDKNYGGALIIWDRMFGTFAAERKDEKVAYGLVSPLNSFNPFYAQVKQPVVVYGGVPSAWLSVYTFLHYIASVPVYDKLMQLRLQVAANIIVLDVVFILSTLTCFGFLFDKKPYAYYVECIRCVGFGLLFHFCKSTLSSIHELPGVVLNSVEAIYLLSVVMWLLVLSTGRKKKVK